MSSIDHSSIMSESVLADLRAGNSRSPHFLDSLLRFDRRYTVINFIRRKLLDEDMRWILALIGSHRELDQDLGIRLTRRFALELEFDSALVELYIKTRIARQKIGVIHEISFRCLEALTPQELLDSVFEDLSVFKENELKDFGDLDSLIDGCIQSLSDAQYRQKSWIYLPALMVASDPEASRHALERYFSDEDFFVKGVTSKTRSIYERGSPDPVSWSMDTNGSEQMCDFN